MTSLISAGRAETGGGAVRRETEAGARGQGSGGARARPAGAAQAARAHEGAESEAGLREGGPAGHELAQRTAKTRGTNMDHFKAG